MAAEVVRLARKASRREIEIVTDLLMTSAIAVASEIAEGTAFHDPHAQHRHYQGARQSLLRLETELAVARQAGLFDEDAVAGLSRRAQGVARLLGGYLVYLERQRAITPAGS